MQLFLSRYKYLMIFMLIFATFFLSLIPVYALAPSSIFVPQSKEYLDFSKRVKNIILHKDFQNKKFLQLEKIDRIALSQYRKFLKVVFLLNSTAQNRYLKVFSFLQEILECDPTNKAMNIEIVRIVDYLFNNKSKLAKETRLFKSAAFIPVLGKSKQISKYLQEIFNSDTSVGKKDNAAVCLIFRGENIGVYINYFKQRLLFSKRGVARYELEKKLEKILRVSEELNLDLELLISLLDEKYERELFSGTVSSTVCLDVSVLEALNRRAKNGSRELVIRRLIEICDTMQSNSIKSRILRIFPECEISKSA